MNCQHCGVELTNKRAKNCKTCSSILQDANRYGTYCFVMEAIAQAKADEITGADMHEAMRSAMKLGAAKRNEWMDSYRAWRKQLDAERKEYEYEQEEEDARADLEALRKMDAEKRIGRGDLEEEYGR